MERRGAVGGRGGSGSGGAGSLSALFAGAAGVAGALVSLFKPHAQGARAAASSKGSIQSGAAVPAGAFDGGQSSRIAAYESGRAEHDLDNEGVQFGPLRLTPERMILWGSCLFVYLNYTIRGVLATVETVGTPTLARFRHIAPGSPLEVEASATFFGLLGLLGCVVFFLQWYLQEWIDEPTTLVAGFAVTLAGTGMIMFAPGSEQAFIAGCVCIWSFGLPAVQNSVLAALSRILGTRVSVRKFVCAAEPESHALLSFDELTLLVPVRVLAPLPVLSLCSASRHVDGLDPNFRFSGPRDLPPHHQVFQHRVRILPIHDGMCHCDRTTARLHQTRQAHHVRRRRERTERASPAANSSAPSLFKILQRFAYTAFQF